jgi:hypothetical protein
MKKLMVLLLVLLISSVAYAGEILDELKKSPLYPAEYWITTDYNPDKSRDWTFNEVSNGFKWKDKNKKFFFMPDEYILQWDYNPDKERDWTVQEITGGVKWLLK